MSLHEQLVSEAKSNRLINSSKERYSQLSNSSKRTYDQQYLRFRLGQILDLAPETIAVRQEGDQTVLIADDISVYGYMNGPEKAHFKLISENLYSNGRRLSDPEALLCQTAYTDDWCIFSDRAELQETLLQEETRAKAVCFNVAEETLHSVGAKFATAGAWVLTIAGYFALGGSLAGEFNSFADIAISVLSFAIPMTTFMLMNNLLAKRHKLLLTSQSVYHQNKKDRPDAAAAIDADVVSTISADSNSPLGGDEFQQFLSRLEGSHPDQRFAQEELLAEA